MGSLRILLLTHEHELTKRTNTGRVVLEALGNVARRIVWQRTAPEAELLRAIEAGGAALVWPSVAQGGAAPVREPNTFVVIDGTWQQARKMYNRSPYLHGLPTVALQPTEPSIYTLRRNQVSGGLCTAEAVACLLERPELARHGGAPFARAITAHLRSFIADAGDIARRHRTVSTPLAESGGGEASSGSTCCSE
ncbi:MAG: tRNA-uridine aminocarboxypropyltransferase [Nannocystales bacterium]